MDFLFVCFLKEWAGQTIFNDFQDAFVVDFCVVPKG
jgi:Fanconi anemia group D2 protein